MVSSKPNTKGSLEQWNGGLLLISDSNLTKTFSTVELTNHWIILKIKPHTPLNPSSKIAYIIFAYLPPKTSQELLDNFENLLFTIQNSNSPLLIMGDFNARMAPFDITSTLYIQNTNIEAIRHSQDTKSNNRGKWLNDIIIDNNLIILNGRTRSDKAGNYTFISHQGQSQIDLAITNTSFTEQIADLRIIPKSSSDHLPLEVTLLENNHTQNINQTKLYKYEKIIWKNSMADQYQQKAIDYFNTNPLEDARNSLNPDIMFKEIHDNLHQIAKELNLKTITPTEFRTYYRKSKWFTKECQELKWEKNTALKQFNNHPNNNNRKIYINLKQKYKQLCLQLKSEFQSEWLANLTQAKTPKQFWDMIGKIKTKEYHTEPKITLTQWENYWMDTHKVPPAILNHEQTNYIKYLKNKFNNNLNHSHELDGPIKISEIKDYKKTSDKQSPWKRYDSERNV